MTGDQRRGLLENDDYVGILIRAAEDAELAACVQRTAFADGLIGEDDLGVAEWSEKQARCFRHAAGLLADTALEDAARHALTFIENRFSDLSPEKRATVEHLRKAFAARKDSA